MTARSASQLARFPATAGGLVFGLSVGKLAAEWRLGPAGGTPWATTGLTVAVALALAVAGRFLFGRLSANWRRAALPGCVSLLVLLPSLLGDSRLLVTALAAGVAVCVTGAGWLWRTGRQTLAWLAVPGLAAALCLTIDSRLGVGVVLAVMLIFGVVAVRSTRGAPRGVGAVLAVSMPLCMLPLVNALGVRFTVGGAVVGGYDLAWGRHLLVAAVTTTFAALLVASRLRPSWIPVPRARSLAVSIGLALLALATSFSYRIHTDPIGDREGRQLASLTALESGARPFRDLRIVDGLGEQLILPGVATEIAGRSIRSLRLVKAILGPLDHAVLVLLGAALLPPRWGALYGFAVVLGVVGPADDGRGLVAHLALLAVALALKTRPRVRLVAPIALVGGLVGTAILWRSDLGLIVGVAAILSLGLSDLPSADRWRRVARFAGGVIAVVATGVVALFACGAIPERALDLLVGNASRGWRWWPALATVTAVVALAATRALARRRLDRVALVAGYVTLTAGFGTSDGNAAELNWALPLLALACCAASGRLEPHLSALAMAALVVPMVPGNSPLLSCLQTFARQGEAKLDDRSDVQLPGAKEIEKRFGILLSSAEAHRLAPATVALRALTAGRPYFDFTDTPILHFLSGVPPASRYLNSPRSEAEHRRLAAELDANLPDVVLFWREPAPDLVGGADPIGVNDLVAEVIVANYRPRQAVGGFAMLTRVDAARAGPAVPIPDYVELGELAFRLGEKPPGDDAQARVLASAELEATPGLPVRLALAAHARPRARLLDLELTAGESGVGTLRWTAGSEASPTGVRFAVRAGTHRYRLPLRALPGWVWPATLDAFELSAPRAGLRRVGWALIAAK